MTSNGIRSASSKVRITVCLIALLTGAGLVVVCERPASGYVPFASLQKVPYKWNLSNFPAGAVPWQLEAGGPDIVRQAVGYATSTWSDATHGELKFVEGPGGIIIGWDADGSRVIDAGYLAYTTFNVAAGTQDIALARIVVNAFDYQWHVGSPCGETNTATGRDADLNGVLLHEFGHALGLDHSDKDPSKIVGMVGYNNYPTMNSTVFSGIETLHADDVAGIQSLYGYLTSSQSGYEVGVFSITAAKTKRRPKATYTFQSVGGDEGTLWDFGDGTMASGLTVEHRYLRRGEFIVTALWNGTTATTTVKGLPGKMRLKDLIP
jgi:hypothetical protein